MCLQHAASGQATQGLIPSALLSARVHRRLVKKPSVGLLASRCVRQTSRGKGRWATSNGRPEFARPSGRVRVPVARSRKLTGRGAGKVPLPLSHEMEQNEIFFELKKALLMELGAAVSHKKKKTFKNGTMQANS